MSALGRWVETKLLCSAANTKAIDATLPQASPAKMRLEAGPGGSSND